jgi:hypothetical protein
METIPALDELLTELERREIKLHADGDRLRFTAPPGALSPALRSQLHANKTELLALMHKEAERATAICRPSLVQSRFWKLQKLNPEESFYNDPFVFELRGRLDTDILRQSLNAIVRRHESLRTRLEEIDGQLMQVIAPAGEVNLTILDLRSLSTVERAGSIKRLLKEEMGRPFDLAREPGFRVLLLQTGDEVFFLEICFHNTLFDLNSLFVMLNELSLYYSSGLVGGWPVLQPPAQYADYVRWLESGMATGLEGRLDYWRDWFRTGPPPAWSWVNAKPTPATTSYHNLLTWDHCSAGLTTSLKGLSQRHGATLYITALTAFALVLKRNAGCSDVTFGTTYSNRDHWRFESLIGATIQVPAIRIDLEEDTDYAGAIARMRAVVAGALTWQEVPLESLAPQLGFAIAPGPLFRVVVTYWPDVPAGRLELPGIEVNFLETMVHDSSRPDLYLVLFENKTPEGSVLTWYWMHKQDIFERETADKMNREFRELLEGMVAAG